MPRKHVLKFLIEKCKAYTLELAKVFPLDTEEEKHLFELLDAPISKPAITTNLLFQRRL